MKKIKWFTRIEFQSLEKASIPILKASTTLDMVHQKRQKKKLNDILKDIERWIKN